MEVISGCCDGNMACLSTRLIISVDDKIA